MSKRWNGMAGLVSVGLLGLCGSGCRSAAEAPAATPAAAPAESSTAPAESTAVSAAPEAPAIRYPLATCIVSDEPLDGMGEPYVFVHEGREIKLCCKGCLKDFQKDPATYLAKLK